MSSFIDKVIWPLIVLALTPTVTLIGSKIQSGDWLTWLKKIPLWVYWLFLGAIIGWILLVALIRRIRYLHKKNLPSLPLGFSIPRWGYVKVGTLNYQDVVWCIRIPAPSPLRNIGVEKVRNPRVDVETPPRCPKCETELEQTETFFGRYRWTCLRCGFSKKNSISFYHEAVRVQKLAQSQWED